MNPNKQNKLLESLYAWLLVMYPKDFYNRFAVEMKETFKDLLLEKTSQNGNILSFAFGVYLEIFINILKENITFYHMNYISIIRSGLITLAVLSIPFVAMQSGGNVNWTAFDFLAAGLILAFVFSTIELVSKKSNNLYYRLGPIVSVFTAAFMLVSVSAVSLIGSVGEPANLVYYGVFVALIITSILAKFKPKSMAVAMSSITGLLIFITIIAIALGWQNLLGSSLFEVVAVNGFFGVLFAISAGLFYISSSQKSITNKISDLKV